MDALKLTFTNGDTLSVPFNEDSTLTIDTPDGPNGVKHGAWGEVANVEFVKDTGDVVDATVPETPPAVEPVPVVPDTPPDTSLLQKVETKLGIGTHDEVVASAQTDVAVAQAGAADDPAAHLTQAIADVNAALITYPDSVELQDAKAQLEQLATPPELVV